MFLKDYLLKLLEAKSILKLDDHDFNFNVLKYNKKIEENSILDSDIKEFEQYYNNFVNYLKRNREKISSLLLKEMIFDKYGVSVNIPYLKVDITECKDVVDLANKIKEVSIEKFIFLQESIKNKQKKDIVMLDSFIDNYFNLNRKFGVATVKEIIDDIEGEENLSESKEIKNKKSNKVLKGTSISNRLKDSLNKII